MNATPAPPTRLLLALLLLVFTGCATTSASDVLEARNMALVRRAHADLAAGDLAGFQAALHPDYVRHCQAMPPELEELRDKQVFFGFLEEFTSAAPGYTDTLSNMIAQGDRVAYVSTLEGVQTGPMGDLPASGRPFRLVNIIIQRLEGGRIAETWVSWDNVAFLTQLGFMP